MGAEHPPQIATTYPATQSSERCIKAIALLLHRHDILIGRNYRIREVLQMACHGKEQHRVNNAGLAHF
jgi:hypothetical protein